MLDSLFAYFILLGKLHTISLEKLVIAILISHDEISAVGRVP